MMTYARGRIYEGEINGKEDGKVLSRLKKIDQLRGFSWHTSIVIPATTTTATSSQAHTFVSVQNHNNLFGEGKAIVTNDWNGGATCSYTEESCVGIGQV